MSPNTKMESIQYIKEGEFVWVLLNNRPYKGMISKVSWKSSMEEIQYHIIVPQQKYVNVFQCTEAQYYSHEVHTTLDGLLQYLASTQSTLLHSILNANEGMDKKLLLSSSFTPNGKRIIVP